MTVRAMVLFRAELTPTDFNFFDDETTAAHDRLCEAVDAFMRQMNQDHGNPMTVRLNVVAGDGDDGYAPGAGFWLGDVLYAATVDGDDPVAASAQLAADIASRFSGGSPGPLAEAGNLSVTAFDRDAYAKAMCWDNQE